MPIGRTIKAMYVCMYVTLKRQNIQFPEYSIDDLQQRAFISGVNKKESINGILKCACILNFTSYLEVLQCVRLRKVIILEQEPITSPPDYRPRSHLGARSISDRSGFYTS